MKNTLLHFLLLMLLLTGKTAFSQDTIRQELPPFNRIKILENATVYLGIGPVQQVTISSKSINKVRTKVEDGALEISGVRSTLYVTVPELTAVSIAGAGKIIADSMIRTNSLRVSISGSGHISLPVTVKSLDVSISGSGNITMKGSAEQAEVSISGSGRINASGLQVKTCKTKISGVGKCYADVTESLDLRISGSGSFYYKTKPASLYVSVSGIGKYGIGDSNSDDDETSRRNSTDSTSIDGSITVIGSGSEDDDDSYTFRWWDGISSSDYNERARSHWGGVDIGFNQLMRSDRFSASLPQGYDYLELNPGKSINVNVNLFYHDFRLVKRHLLFTTGIGLTLNNYRFNDSRTLLADTNRVMADFDLDQNGNQIKYEKNKLAVNYITVPLLLQWNSRQEFGKSFHVATGLLVSYKYSSHLKLVYNEDGDREKTKRRDDFNINPFRCDMTLRLGYEYYTLYASYSLGTLFRDNRGPSLQPFQVGINLFGW